MAEVYDLKAPLAAVMRDFPSQRARIEALAAISEEFTMLCDDYALTAATLRRLLASEGRADPAWIRDYREILSGLAREIAVVLADARLR